jgi:hypothetical protein
MFRRSKRLEKKLREHGRQAPAEVLEAEGTGVGITRGNPAFLQNTQLVWKLKLRVKPADEPPFETETKTRFPQLAGPHPGATLNVLYDPDDHSKVVVDSSPEGAAEALLGESMGELVREAVADPAGFREQMQDRANQIAAAFGAPGATHSDPVDQLERLADLKERGALTQEEFEAEKRRILGT